MNNVFDFSRFGKYFAYDLRNMKERFGWSMLVLCLLPVIVFVICELFSLTISGHFTRMPDAIRYMVVYLAFVVAVLISPSKIWGRITDKRYGSDYLMLPASGFEKWLSMMLICFLVLPLCLSLITLAGDAFSTLIFAGAYASRPMLSELCSFDLSEFSEGVDLNFFGLGYVSWLCNILIFTLGALCFKRSKAAKTLLVAFLVAMLLGLLSIVFFGQASFTTEELEFLFDDPDPEQIVSRINLISNIFFSVVIMGLMAAIYLRIKTIKH